MTTLIHENNNIILENLEKRLSLQAEREFERARRYVDDASKEPNIVSGHSPYMISQARLATIQGNRWKERAEVAAKGYFLATSDDLPAPPSFFTPAGEGMGRFPLISAKFGAYQGA